MCKWWREASKSIRCIHLNTKCYANLFVQLSPILYLIPVVTCNNAALAKWWVTVTQGDKQTFPQSSLEYCDLLVSCP